MKLAGIVLLILGGLWLLAHALDRDACAQRQIVELGEPSNAYRAMLNAHPLVAEPVVSRGVSDAGLQ